MNIRQFLAGATLLGSMNALAGPCSDNNNAILMARDSTKALLEISGTPTQVTYFGGIMDSDSEKTLVTLEPHYRFSKDWYHVIIRNNDCRVLAIELRGENLPIDNPANAPMSALE